MENAFTKYYVILIVKQFQKTFKCCEMQNKTKQNKKKKQKEKEKNRKEKLDDTTHCSFLYFSWSEEKHLL